jgi:hypothetical protein
MSELSDESRALIEAEGPLDEATSLEIEAMRVRVVAALGAVPAPGPSPDPTPLAGKAAATASLKVIGSAVAAAVGSSALLFALNQPAPEPALPAVSAQAPVVALPSPPTAAPAAAPVESIEPAASAAPTAVAAPLPRPGKPSAPAASNPAPPARSTSEEALLVATAEAQLRGGHPAAALALYEQHLRDYPKGALRYESQSGRIVALCGVGRASEARAEIARFAERHPGSQALLRMQRACGLDP